MLILNSTKKQQTGLSMIESLVALLVISIGLLGIASLQLSSLKQSSSAQWHTQAVWMSYEMTDRISSNRSAFNQYGVIDTNNTYNQDCEGSLCTPGQMVEADALDWKEMVTNLPQGRGVILPPAGGGANTLIVSIMWKDNSDESNCINGEPDANDMTCYTVTVTR